MTSPTMRVARRRGAPPRERRRRCRASRLSPAGDGRERRLLEGIDLLLVGGEVARAAAFADEVRGCVDGPYPRYLLGRLAFHSGHPVEGEKLLLAAWEVRDSGGDRQLASKIASDIALVLVRRSRGPQLVTWARRALAAAAGTSQQHAPWYTLAYGLAYARPLRKEGDLAQTLLGAAGVGEAICQGVPGRVLLAGAGRRGQGTAGPGDQLRAP